MQIMYSKVSLKSSEVLDYKFLGSAVRGVFGVALKKVVCINPSGECGGCFAKDDCLYYDFFESSFAKYRLNLELGGALDFDLYLFEEASLKAPYVISALYKAFRDIGITKKRIKPDFKLFFNDKVVFDGEFFSFDNQPVVYKPNSYQKSAVLKLKTPLRIKTDNRFLRNDLPVSSLLRSVNHRYLKLKNKEIAKLSFTPEYKIKSKKLTFIELQRFSNRQKTKMKLGGLVGEIGFEYIDENSYRLLELAEVIGAGKQVTFGLGKVEVI